MAATATGRPAVGRHFSRRLKPCLQPAQDVDAVHLQRADDEYISAVNRAPRLAVGAEAEPSSDDHRAFILPMSDRTALFTIAGTPTSGAEFVLKASSKEPTALLLLSSCVRARSSKSLPGCSIRRPAPA